MPRTAKPSLIPCQALRGDFSGIQRDPSSKDLPWHNAIGVLMTSSNDLPLAKYHMSEDGNCLSWRELEYRRNLKSKSLVIYQCPRKIKKRKEECNGVVESLDRQLQEASGEFDGVYCQPAVPN